MRLTSWTLLRRLVAFTLACAGLCVGANAQSQPAQKAPEELPSAPAPTGAALSAYQASLPAGVTVQHPTGDTPSLSIDGAITLALAHNLSVQVSGANERRIKGIESTVLNYLTPALTATAYSNAQEINLAAMGFKPQSIGPLISQLGPAGGSFPTIVKVNVTSAQINIAQQLFNLPAYDLYKASRSAGTVASFQAKHASGSVVFETGSQYLRIISDASQIANVRSQIVTDQLALDQARARQNQGVGIHLDTLRAQVQLQSDQQTLTSAESNYEKDKIQLNRLMGLAADQRFVYVDVAPFADLAGTPLDELTRRAYASRNDLQGLEAQRDVLLRTERAARYERVPTLSMTGYYGVLGETTGLYHGVFNVQGQLSFPIFEEAQFRGEREVSRSELLTVTHQIDSLHGTIGQQLRDSLLDIRSDRELVDVARSNVILARQQLADSVERFKAGVDDNLPVVQSQSSLAAAETRLVQANYQFNVAKLQLSYYLGGIENDFQVLLGSHP